MERNIQAITLLLASITLPACENGVQRQVRLEGDAGDGEGAALIGAARDGQVALVQDEDP